MEAEEGAAAHRWQVGGTVFRGMGVDIFMDVRVSAVRWLFCLVCMCMWVYVAAAPGSLEKAEYSALLWY